MMVRTEILLRTNVRMLIGVGWGGGVFGKPRLSGTRRVGTHSLCVSLSVSLESCVCVCKVTPSQGIGL
jgi:hypothetical protein